MSRQNKSKKTRGPKGNGKRSIAPGEIVYTGKHLLSPTVATSTTVALTLQSFLTTNTSEVLGTLGTTFSMYRFEKLQFVIYPAFIATPGTGILALSYSNEVSDTPPATISAIASMPMSILASPEQTVTSRLRIPKRYLLGENSSKFWRTQVSVAATPTSTLWDDIQGTIFLRHNISVTVSYSILMLYSVRLVDAQPPVTVPHPLPPAQLGEMASFPKHAGTRFPCTAPGIMCVLQIHGLPCEFHDTPHLL